MKRDEFLAQLRQAISGLSTEEINEIIRDQEEYIQDAIRSGRTEEEVIRSLGDPKIFANSLMAESKIQNAEKVSSLDQKVTQTINATVALLALTPLNIIFVLVPFLLAVLLIVFSWLGAIAVLVSAFVLMTIFFAKLVFVAAGFWSHLSFLSFAVGVAGVGIIAIFFAYKLTRFFIFCLLAYLRWNLNFIKARV